MGMTSWERAVLALVTIAIVALMAMARIRQPTSIARYRCAISFHALGIETGPCGECACADWMASLASAGVNSP